MLISSSRDWLGNSVLSQNADAYVGYLHRHGFCAGTVQCPELVKSFETPAGIVY